MVTLHFLGTMHDAVCSFMSCTWDTVYIRDIKLHTASYILLKKYGVVYIWGCLYIYVAPRMGYFLVNFHIYSSLFYLAKSQSQCLLAIGRDGGLSNLCHACGLLVSRGC